MGIIAEKQQADIVQALGGNLLRRPPIWFMRQVGRFMPEYQKLRKKWDLMTLFTQPELIVEATHLGPDVLGVDAAIVFSDILLILNLFGCDLGFTDRGPFVKNPLTLERVQNCRKERDQELSFVLSSLTELKKTLSCPLLGFAGAPFTVAAFGMRNCGESHDRKIMEMMYRAPKDLEQILDVLCEETIEYLLAQFQHGADCVQVFESMSNLMDLDAFERFSFPYLRRISQRCSQEGIPLLIFSRFSEYFLPYLSQLDSALSIDWQSDLQRVRNLFPGFLQGNLHPWVLLDRNRALAETRKIIKSRGSDRKYIFNLGHGIPPQADVEVVKEVINVFKQEAKWD